MTHRPSGPDQPADAALRPEERLALALDAGGMGAWERDLIAGTVMFDRRTSVLYGLPVQDAPMPAAMIEAQIHPDDRAEVEAAREAALVSGERYEFEYRVRCEDDTYRWVHVNARPQYDAYGRPTRLFGVSFDVTARRAAEEALRASEAQHRLALEATRLGTWHWDAATGLLTTDARARAVLGLRDDEASLPTEAFNDRVHPDDLARLQHATRTAMDPAGEGRFDETYRALQPDGSFRWVQSTARTFFDGDGDARYPARSVGTMLDVTEQHTREAALRESEALFRGLVHNSSEIVTLLGADGVIRYQSPSIEHVLGHDPAALVGRSAFEFVHEDDRADLVGVFETLVKGQREARAAYRYRAAQGGWRRLESSAVNLLDDPYVAALVINSRDVTERWEAEAALSSAESRFRALVEQSLTGIYVIDEGVIAYANPEFARMLGYAAPEDLIGVHISALVAPEYLAVVGENLRKRMNGEAAEVRYEVEGLRRDGTRVNVELFGSVATENGRRIVIGTALDVTDRRRAEAGLVRQQQELQTLNESLEQRVAARTQELEETNRTLGLRNRELQDFAYVASHDLQEPLRKIRAFAGLIREESADALGAEAQRYLDRVEGAAARMSALIADLLAFSRVTTQGDPFVPVNLADTLAGVLSDLEVRLTDTGGRVEVAGTLPVVLADAVQMRQVLQNLIANALKYSRPDVPPVVRVSCAHEAGTVRLTVEDNGIGFEQKYAERIFAPFQRLHARGTYEGTGMGLAIVRRIAERHGGSVEATSTPGEGSRFAVTLRPPRP